MAVTLSFEQLSPAQQATLTELAETDLRHVAGGWQGPCGILRQSPTLMSLSKRALVRFTFVGRARTAVITAAGRALLATKRQSTSEAA
jgi:hypothetical protein